ncbi:MAG: SDR family NAD(P)-dependent oxidoreductase, partial [Novosphingobium sp.]
MARLSGKVAIVTGSGTGQGEAEVRLFADEGAKVLVADVNFGSAQKVAEEINAKNANSAIAVSLDVSKEADWQKAVQVAADTFGPITILVNNAGILAPVTYDMLTHDHWTRTMDVNAWGQMLGMQTVIPVMKRSGGGSIVNVSSLAVVNACGRFTAYTASKGAVDAITRAAAIELASFNIRVNSIAPGVIHTSMVEEAFPTKSA